MSESTKLSLEFDIIGENLNPDKLNKILKFEKYNCWINGKSITGGKDLKVKENSFEYKIGPIESNDIEELTDTFYQQIKPSEEELKKFLTDNSLEVHLSIVARIYPDDKPAMYMKSSFLELISRLGCTLDIPIYIFGDWR